MPALIPGKPELPSQFLQPPVFVPGGSVIGVGESDEIMRTRRPARATRGRQSQPAGLQMPCCALRSP
eukprot:7196344-Alexandrium_andersonii.AAC.1